MQDGWNERATNLNKLPMPGKVLEVLEEIEECKIRNMLRDSLTDEWKRSTKVLHNALLKDPSPGQV